MDDTTVIISDSYRFVDEKRAAALSVVTVCPVLYRDGALQDLMVDLLWSLDVIIQSIEKV